MKRGVWYVLLGVAVPLALAVVPSVTQNQYYLHILVLVLLYVTLALGLNIVVGFAGLLDLGYVAFYAIGAYTYAILSTHWHISFWLSLPVGGLLAAIMGIALGLPALRVRGDYLALVTLGLGEIVRLTLENWESLTNGPRGIMSIDGPHFHTSRVSSPLEYYYLALGLAVITTLFVLRIRYSSIGRILAAVRDEEMAAQCVGIEPVRWKLYAFATGAFIAGVGGVFFAGWQHFVSPESFTLLESVLILCIVVMGGMGSIPGTIIAATFLVAAPEVLRGLAQYRLLVFGLVLVCVIVMQEKIRQRGLRSSVAKSLAHSNGTNGVRQQSSTMRGGWVGSEVGERPVETKPLVLLRVLGLKKSYDGIKAVQDISFEVGSGEIVALIGPNGAGKTTVFHCVSGVLKPDAGTIQLAGRDGVLNSIKLRPHIIARRGIARTFQDIRLFQNMTAVDHVLLGTNCGQGVTPLELLAMFPKVFRRDRDNHKLACRLLNCVGIKDPFRLASALTLVEQRRLGLARALATNPKVLLLDEPAAGLNESEKIHFCQLLQSIRDDLSISIVLIEHDMRNVVMTTVRSGPVKVHESQTASTEEKRLVDRIIVMDQGRLIAEGPPGEIQSSPLVKEVYLGKGYQ